MAAALTAAVDLKPKGNEPDARSLERSLQHDSRTACSSLTAAERESLPGERGAGEEVREAMPAGEEPAADGELCPDGGSLAAADDGPYTILRIKRKRTDAPLDALGTTHHISLAHVSDSGRPSREAPPK